jgi:hypothetical protein
MTRSVCSVVAVLCLLWLGQQSASANWCPWDTCVDLPAGAENIPGESQCCDGATVLHAGDCTADDPASAYTCQNRRYRWNGKHDAKCSDPNPEEQGEKDCGAVEVLRNTQIGVCTDGGCIYFFVPGSGVLIATKECWDCF